MWYVVRNLLILFYNSILTFGDKFITKLIKMRKFPIFLAASGSCSGPHCAENYKFEAFESNKATCSFYIHSK